MHVHTAAARQEDKGLEHDRITGLLIGSRFAYLQAPRLYEL